ncbi:hypothetical protein D3C71_1782210 [compost metagenome]
MDLRVRQIEGATQRMTQLVVQPCRDAAEHGAAQPRPVERIAACGERFGTVLATFPGNDRQRTTQRRDAFARHPVADRVAIARVQALGRMGDGIDAAGHTDHARQTQG